MGCFSQNFGSISNYSHFFLLFRLLVKKMSAIFFFLYYLEEKKKSNVLSVFLTYLCYRDKELQLVFESKQISFLFSFIVVLYLLF